ncbi:MAG: hypothetical protein E3K40_04700 [Candidatus Brocadia sp.]|nr:hypothetical protein [Candidatus Brocadia sp.]
MVFQDFAIRLYLAVYESIEFRLKIRSFIKAERKNRVEAVFGRVNTQKYTGKFRNDNGVDYYCSDNS